MEASKYLGNKAHLMGALLPSAPFQILPTRTAYSIGDATPAKIITRALQKQGPRMLNEHQMNNQRTGEGQAQRRKKNPFFNLITLF